MKKKDKPVFTSSYHKPAQREFLTSFVELIAPITAVDIGTQQGSSAILIGKAMGSGTQLFTYDLFEPNYQQPPHKPTHADQEAALLNIQRARLVCKVHLVKADAAWAATQHQQIDLLHLDICNHLTTMQALLPLFVPKVTRAIVLEGGVHNKWQREYGYSSYRPWLDADPLFAGWDKLTVPFNEHNAVTLLVKRGIYG